MAMMRVEEITDFLFVDTNVWLYATDPASVFHAQAQQALDRVHDLGTTLVTSPQILREYLAVGTRPNVSGGRSTLADLLANVDDIRTRCHLVEETTAVVDQLAALLRALPTASRRIHDANIVATMLAWDISHILTHNVADFTPYQHRIVVVPLISAHS